jgi:hypothetical protein
MESSFVRAQLFYGCALVLFSLISWMHEEERRFGIGGALMYTERVMFFFNI